MGSVTDDEARIAARYPKASWTDYVLGGGAVVTLIMIIVLVAISGLERSNPPVVAMVRGFEVTSPSELTAELVVQRKDPSDAVECRVYAQAQSYETVAEDIVEVGPGTEKLTAVNVTLKTIKEATSISIDACRLAG